MQDNIPITVIGDVVGDSNASGRMTTRMASLFPGSYIGFVGVRKDIEAAICLVDTLDALEDRPGVILVNVAPRNGMAKRKWPNGTPFIETSVNKVQIFSTVDGYTLSLLQDLAGGKLRMRLYGVPEVVPFLEVSPEVQARIISSQFRSFDFLPRLAKARIDGKELPYAPLVRIANYPITPECVAFCDIFGNLKTSIVFRGQFEPDQLLKVTVGEKSERVKFFPGLKDVPDQELGIVVGSSGFCGSRFLELVVQGGSAFSHLGNPAVGVSVKFSPPE